MEKKRKIINIGLILLLIFLSIVYHSFFLGLEKIQDLEAVSDSIVELILLMPSITGLTGRSVINNIILLFQLVYLLIIVAAIYKFFTKKSAEGKKETKIRIIKIIKFVVALLITSVSTLLLSSLFFFSWFFANKIINVDLNVFIDLLKEEMVFIIPALSLFTVRYFLSALLAILFPVTVFLYTLRSTRLMGKIMLDQTIIWTFVNDIILLVLLIISLFIRGIRGIEPPIFLVALFTTILLIASPVAMLKIIDLVESGLIMLLRISKNLIKKILKQIISKI